MSATEVTTAVLRRASLLAGADDDALAELAADAQETHLLAGEWLLHEGAAADDFFVIVQGRVRAVADAATDDERTLRVLGSGATIGELALLTGAHRSASVQALRDTTLLRLSREPFVALLERDAQFAATVAVELARQLQASGGLTTRDARPAVIAVRPLGPGDRAVGVARSLSTALERYGTVELVGPEPVTPETLEAAEESNAHVVLVDDATDRAWSDRCARQADRVLLVTGEDTPLPGTASPAADLVVVGPCSGAGLGALLDAVAPRAHHRLASTEPSDPGISRLARRLVGRALGIVLSGGGARGFAHIGVLEELERDGIEIDRYGGCSMGSFIAAMAAAGWRPTHIRDRCHEELVRRSPFNDYTIPRVALIRSRKAGRMLERLFTDLTVEELAKPLFTVSADLLSSRLVVHRRGSLLEAVGASMSIPGLVPPLPRGGQLLVDGGVLNNLPVDEMTASAEGPVIAVDVVRRLEGSADDASLPTIMETLSRATVLGSVERAEHNRSLALLVISPDVNDIPLRDFRSLDRAVEAGRAAARDALDRGARDVILDAVDAPVG